MLAKELNDLLTQTGRETPLGQYLRRFWQPALLSEEIPTPDSPPAQVRILGEELVAFRDSSGRIGLIEEHCLHRGTSLVYGRNEECGLRCIYHGWKYDVEGRVLDTPAEPESSDFKARLRQPAYPTREAAGIVWAYLGPPEKQPAFQEYVWAAVPTENTYIAKSMLECSWLQGLEGECDSAHLSFLHREFGQAGRQAYYAQDSAPAYETEETDFGIRLIAIRKTPDSRSYVRVSSFVAPNQVWVPARNKENHMYVPIDDRHTWRFDLGFFTDRPATPDDNHRRLQIGPDYRRIRNQRNGYLQDREAQRTRDFTGIEDFLNEDGCATETMGAIYDRRREHLGQSDKAVIAVRRYLIDALQAFQAAAEPACLGTARECAPDLSHVDTLAELAPPGDWHQHFPHLTLAASSRRSDRVPVGGAIID